MTGPKKVLAPNFTRTVAVPAATPLTVKLVLPEAGEIVALVLEAPAEMFVTVSKVSCPSALAGVTVAVSETLLPSHKATKLVEKLTFTTCKVPVSVQLGKPVALAVMV